jgi:membrane-bound metal-dependent hydrolase YbcI (DUF457 family)
MALAYLLGKGSSKPLHLKPNIPALLVLSILPDIDIIYDFLTRSEIHRGPTHSIIVAILVFLPFFIIYRKKTIPYFLALTSHLLIGDIGGQMQLLWPFSTTSYGFDVLSIFSPVNVLIELSLFAVATFVLYKTHDWKVFFTNDKTNLILIIPIATVLLPTTVGYPFSQSLLLSNLFIVRILGVAHLFYLVLFSIAILKTLTARRNKNRGQIYRRELRLTEYKELNLWLFLL